MKNIINSILISIISINTYAICPFPADTKPPNEGIIPWLGGGFDFDRERIKVISCLNGQKVLNGGGEVILVWVVVRLLLIKLLKKDLKLGNGRFDIDSSDPLNDTADRVKTDACKFKELCGNNFV